MAWNYYFKDRSGAQNGPVSLEELVALVSARRVAPDCLVWPEGGEPGPAGSMRALAEAFAQDRDGGGLVGPDGEDGDGRLRPDFPAWGLFWRAIVASIGMALIFPAPWVALWFYRWQTSRISLPNGQRLSLESTIGESWWIFVGLGVTQLLLPAGNFSDGARGDVGFVLGVIVLTLASLAAYLWLSVRLIRWLCQSLRSEGGGLSVDFHGTAWGYFGWTLLFILSCFTIIGWAWVGKYWARWLCRNVRGSHSFEFVGDGWDILWLVLAGLFGCVFIVTIPWIIAWLANWGWSQVVVTPAASMRSSSPTA